MELTVPYKPNPLLFSSTPLTHNTQTFILLKLPKNPRSKNSHHRPNFRVLAFANPNGFDGFSWLSLTRSVRRGLEWLWAKLGESGKKETGFCLEDANVKVGEFVGRAKEGVSKGRAGKLHCKIDKVARVLETNRPDAKNALYQATIKQGDFLLNRIQKLSRVVDL
ncbi:hypothetical protein SO802_012388 [Lithocarpus litseifolius]|uniref:26S proteasome regulatory subunit RPN7/PSMD6 C-terminal helix domain-containing protein n=1 Tax=Lithocarpus litseifolius TaxID=425828 RepID=A0AAW2D380_9ROSI